MYGLIIVSLGLLATALAQPDSYTGRGVRVLNRIAPVVDRISNSQWGRVHRPHHIDNGFTRGGCLAYETPSFSVNGQIDRWSYSHQYCYDQRAQCRLISGTTGTCCRPRNIIHGNYCRDGSRGLGSCHTQGDCLRIGLSFECQFFGRGRGTCCRRNIPGLRY